MPEPEVLTDPSDPAVQRLADLAKPSRGAVRTAIVEDLEPLVQALRAGVRFVEVYGESSREFPSQLAALCSEHGVSVRLVDPAVLTRVFRSEKRPKVFGVANVPAPARFSALAEGTGDVLVLDGVKIVGNIGAIVRTAVGLGARGVVLVDSDLPTIADRRVVRASRGHVFSVPVLLETRERVARWLGESGLRVVDVDMDGTLSPESIGDLDEDVALLLGAEKTGASDVLQDLATQTVSVPIDGRVESLNVSVVAGIVLYARSRRHR
ncbi:TrmH family RNA methyltransferase [Curtobacterium sp. MCBD17_032]|uniref:TrmH family RNA methyltransferase n=1 Tax=Curtobacterium sp. MCBD17_032 TaxID=2175659 RepID=UPI001C64A878|nr:TrmH family RNA methyltransferase [Curtobacterium sp. MCBD17_032]